MRRAIRVALGETAHSLGTLRFDAQGARENAAFEYEAAWLATPDGFAIDPGLPFAPAFDVNPFPDRVRELKTWVSEDAGPEATIEALMSALPYFRIAVPRARQMLGKVEQAVARWRSVGHSLGMSTQELDPFADAFEHEERTAARAASQ